MQNFSYEELNRQADRLEEQGNVYRNVTAEINELAIGIAELLGNSDTETADLSATWKNWGSTTSQSGVNSSKKVEQIVSEFRTYINNYKQNESQSGQELKSSSSELAEINALIDAWQP